MVPRASSSTPLISQFINNVENHFLSPSEIDGWLEKLSNNNGFKSLGIQVKVIDVIQHWGVCKGDVITSKDIPGNSGVKLSLFIDCDSETKSDVETQQLSHQILAEFDAIWCNEYRNQHGGLNLKASGAIDIFQNSINRLTDVFSTNNIAISYIDLDNFKPINDTIGHAEGDRVLRHVYSSMHKVMRNLNGLAFFDGGDEFVLAFPADDLLEISAALWSFRKEIQAIPIASKEFSIDATVGIVIQNTLSIFDDVRSIIGVAESLIQDSDGEKKRGTVSFEQEPATQQYNAKEISLENFFKLGVSVSRSRQYIQNVFGNKKLNLIAKLVCTNATVMPEYEILEKEVSSILIWLGIEVSGTCNETYLLDENNNVDQLPKCAIALAVMHGLALAAVKHGWEVNGSQFSLSYDVSGQAITIKYGAVILWGDKQQGDFKLDYGPLIKIGKTDIAQGAVIGIQIGFNNNPVTHGDNRLPLDFFSDRVLVDVRPRIGGGLPDFWQIALAQVIFAFGQEDAPSEILIWGDAPEDTETYKHIINAAVWPLEEMSVLTGYATKKINDLAAKITTQINVINSSKNLLDEIFIRYQSHTGYINRPEEYDGRNKPILRRAMAEGKPLNQSEGIICETAALAYPLAIDTLRKSDKVYLKTDDSDNELRELIAYKIKLTQPLENRIPLYLQDYKNELDSYAQKVLLNKNGVIRSMLEKDNQVDAFLNHLASYLKSENHGRSTRRACINMPNEVQSDGSIKPLGLTSVWASPRFMNDNQAHIDFVFTWRTVEAFIGLPYSIYGSIQLAEQLVADLSGKEGVIELKLGEINYIAMSLHLGSDDFHMRVAKHLVDLASD